MKRKLISIILAVITLLSCTMTAYAEVIEKFENEQHWQIIKFDRNTEGSKIYDGFVNNTDVTPSGDGLTKPFDSDTVMILEKSELYTFASYDNSMKMSNIIDNLSLTTGNTDTTYKFDSDYISANWSGMEALCYATGVGFDPTGCGRKNYIAILGFHNAGKCADSAAYLYIYNADTKALVKTEVIDKSYFYWMYDKNGNLDLDNVDAGNFFQITAGDYNGDGKDSLVFYVGRAVYNTNKGQEADRALYQYDYNVDKKTWSLTEIGLTVGYLNDGWYADGSGETKAGAFWTYNENGNMHKNLCVCLESGDINGDGIDDLAVVSCTGGLNKNEANSNISQVCAAISVGFGKKNTSSVADLTLSEQIEIYSSTGDTPAAPGISIGDIDGDGNNEVVVAGFVNHPDNSKPKNLQDGKVAFAYFKASGTELTLTNGVQTLTDISPISKGDSLREGENLWQQFSVECVNFDGCDSKGQKSKDYIFLNGYVYLWDNSAKTLKKQSVVQDDAELFSNITTKLYDNNDNKYDIDEVFILSAAVGNFTGSNTGEEQLSLTVGFHVNAGKSSDKSGNAYYLGEVTIAKCSIKGNSREGKLCAAYSNSSNRVGSTSYLTNEKIFVGAKDSSDTYLAGFNGMSYVRVACDIGTDSIMGEYVTTEAFYSDPEVVAVLQAAPYFKELEAGNSSTVYSYSETYGTSTTTGYDFTIGVGVCAELETSHFKMEVEETIKSSLSEEFEDSISTTYTTEFEANDLNQVILRRKLYYNYIYTIKTYDGKLPDGIADESDGYLCITVLRNPSVSALTFAQYNAYAEWYNQKMQKKGITDTLNVISEDNMDHYHLLNNEGNPGGYASSLTEYGDTAFSMAKDDTWVQLSNASGTISQEFEKEVESKYTKTTSKGVDVNIKVMGGASFAGNGAFAGVQASMEYVSSTASTVSTVNTTTTKGTVQGISSDLDDYGFQWQLIGWRASSSYPMFDNSNVLFVGYLVSDVTSLPQPVTNLQENYSADTDMVTLTWTSPTISDKRPQISAFWIYQDGTKIAEVKNTGEGVTHSFTVDISDNNTASSTFYVVSYSSSKGLFSLESNVVTSIFSMTKKQTTALIQGMLEDVNAATEALEETLATKAGSDDLTNAINDLTEAYKAADALLKQEIDEAETDIEELAAAQQALATALTDADTALQEAIATVQANLDSAVEDLNAALAAGDQANADALAESIAALTEAYKAADALLKADLEALHNADVEQINSAMQEANAALREAIELVQSNLDTAVEELNAALSAGDTKNAKAIADAIRDMNDQLTQAYDLLAAENESLKNELDATKSDLDATKNDLNDAKERIDSELASIKAELSELQTKLVAQNDHHDEDIQTVTEINGQQDEQQHTNRVIGIVGLSISVVSLLGNAGIIAFDIIRRKKTPIA